MFKTVLVTGPSRLALPPPRPEGYCDQDVGCYHITCAGGCLIALYAKSEADCKAQCKDYSSRDVCNRIHKETGVNFRSKAQGACSGNVVWQDAKCVAEVKSMKIWDGEFWHGKWKEGQKWNALKSTRQDCSLHNEIEGSAQTMSSCEAGCILASKVAVPGGAMYNRKVTADEEAALQAAQKSGVKASMAAVAAMHKHVDGTKVLFGDPGAVVGSLAASLGHPANSAQPPPVLAAVTSNNEHGAAVRTTLLVAGAQLGRPRRPHEGVQRPNPCYPVQQGSDHESVRLD